MDQKDATENGGEWEKSSDFANYFCSYAYLYHQKQMLEDTVRMDSYYQSVTKNKSCFQDKIVLDVGAGTGVLALWAAKAGAKKVYAVEATNMATHARTVMKTNKMDDVVEVIQSSMEDVKLPEKVDIIISEWMGYFLLRESMLDSVLHARDKWLKPGGAMYPSNARIYLAPITEENVVQQNEHEYHKSLDEWSELVSTLKSKYEIDMGELTNNFEAEQRVYCKKTAVWVNLGANALMAEPSLLFEFDCHTVTVKELQEWKSDFSFSISGAGRLCGFAGWFETDFSGSKENPTKEFVCLSTSPHMGYTHWGQQGFFIDPALVCYEGDLVRGEVIATRQKKNHRLLNLDLAFAQHQGTGKVKASQTAKYNID